MFLIHVQSGVQVKLARRGETYQVPGNGKFVYKSVDGFAP